MQDRSAERIQDLLDAASDVVDEVGFDRLTTAMVAERAGAAIGTVYRYFPDRLVLLNALRDRETRMFQDRVLEAIHAHPISEIADAADRAIDVFVEMTRTRTGFRVIQAVDPMRNPNRAPHNPRVGIFARGFAEMIAAEFGIPNSPELLFHMEVIVEIGNSLSAYAFVVDSDGDQRFIDEAKSIVRRYIELNYEAGT